MKKIGEHSEKKEKKRRSANGLGKSESTPGAHADEKNTETKKTGKS